MQTDRIGEGVGGWGGGSREEERERGGEREIHEVRIIATATVRSAGEITALIGVKCFTPGTQAKASLAQTTALLVKENARTLLTRVRTFCW